MVWEHYFGVGNICLVWTCWVLVWEHMFGMDVWGLGVGTYVWYGRIALVLKHNLGVDKHFSVETSVGCVDITLV